MKKGFTLIELLAVILILGVIAVIAIPTVNKLIKDSRRGSWETSGTNMIKAAETYYQAAQLRGKYLDTEMVIIQDGVIKVKTLDESALINLKALMLEISIKGKTPQIEDIINYSVDEKGIANIMFKSDDYVCVNEKPGEKVKCRDDIFSFTYIGDYQTFVVPKTGVYKMELWGAEGGVGSPDGWQGGSEYPIGGKGGYSSGSINLQLGQYFIFMLVAKVKTE